MRLIDADALKEKVYRLLMYRTIEAAIDELPTFDSAPQWISCHERLPEEEDIYLVCFDKNQILENEIQISDAYWKDGEWQYGMIETYEHRTPKMVIEPIDELTVIAWMPLPEPWRGEEHG